MAGGLPEIPLKIGGFGNALVQGSQAGYYTARSRLDQQQADRESDAQQYVQPAMSGDQQAMGKLAYGDPRAAVAVTTALQRMDANQRANIKSAADYTAQASNAVLQADPQDRPAIYQQMYAEGQRRGYKMDGLPPQYTPQVDATLRSHRAMAVPITEWFKQNEGIPTPIGGTAPGGAQGTLAGYESGGNPQAVNPQSGAGGLYQFMPSTWADVRQANPNLNLPETVGQATPQQQGAAEQAFRAGNAQALQAAGIPATPANLYLAHRAGAKGAQAILQASPDAPLSTVVPPEWIAQNPDMRATVGQFVQMANQRFPAGPQATGAPVQLGGAALPQGTQVAGPPMAQMPPPPAGLVPPGTPAQMPGAPAGLVPNGPQPAQMPAPPAQLAGAPQAGPAAPAPAPGAPPAPPPVQGLTAGVKLPPGARMMGIKGVPVVKDGNVLIQTQDGAMDWVPIPQRPPAAAFEDVKDANGNLIGQRNKATNQYHAVTQVPGASSIDPNLKGDDVYAALPPARAAEIRSIVEGDNPIPPPTSRAPYAQETRALVFQAAGPGFTDATHAQRMAMKKDMNTGKIGQALQAQGTLYNHMDHALDIADNINNSPYPLVNKALNAVGMAQGDPRVVELEATKTRINQELEKYFAGHTTVSGLAEARNELNAAQSPEQIKAAVRTLSTLVNGQQSELVHRINRGLGYTGDKALTLEDPLIISPEGAKARDDVLSRTQANPGANSKLMDQGKQFFGAKKPGERPPLESFQK